MSSSTSNPQQTTAFISTHKQVQAKNLSVSDPDISCTSPRTRSRHCAPIAENYPHLDPQKFKSTMVSALDKNNHAASKSLQAKERLQGLNNQLNPSAATTMSSKPRVPTPGVWAPAVTFFNDDDTLDLAAQKKYYAYLAQHLTGLVILGTNAETFMLTREERATLLRTARESVPQGYEIMAGVGGHSTKQVLEFIADARDAGADYALVLPCAYFGKQTSAKVSSFMRSCPEGHGWWQC